MGAARMSNWVVGLTGGIASGKSTVCKLFSELGISIIDADVIAREVVAPGTDALQKITTRFGLNTILNPDQTLNRNALRHIVFNNKADKLWLNDLLHPLIRNEMIQQSADAASDYCILAIPLLIENQLQSLVNTVVVVDIEEDMQLKRACQRDNNSEQLIRNIMASQASRTERLANANYVIDNSNGLDQLQQQVSSLHSTFSSL